MKKTEFKYKTPEGYELRLEVLKHGFVLWSDGNLLIDAILQNTKYSKGNYIAFCKKINRPWGPQRFDYELIADKTPKDCINQHHVHRIVKVGIKG